MPKTGTTAVQRMLHTSGHVLAARGYVYPDRWILGDSGGHHALTKGISRDPVIAFATISDEVRRYLCARRGESIILSAEGLASTLLADGKRQRLLELVERWAAVADITVVMALRRLDEFIASAYLQVTKTGRGNGVLTPELYVHDRGREWTTRLFAGISEFREESGARMVLFPYVEGGDSVAAFLTSVGLEDAPELAAAGPSRQVNRRLGLKAQTAFLLPDQALEVLGVRHRRQLIDLFGAGGFAFSDEVYEYDVLGTELRHQIQTQALDGARRFGIIEYTDAFPKIEAHSAARASLDTSLISAADLSELAAAVEAQNRNPSRGEAGPTAGAHTGRSSHRPRSAPEDRSAAPRSTRR